MNTVKIPDDFFLGGAMSGTQTEGAYNIGGKLPSVWDTWSDRRIGDFHNLIGSYVGNDFYHRHQEDISILKALGMTSFRISIQWSRLLDQNGAINPEGAAFYHRLFACARSVGMKVFVTLYHFDMPDYLSRRGGWESREVVEAFSNYAAKAFKEFGDEVVYWFTLNEPTTEPENCYRNGAWYPFVRDFGRSIQVMYHESLAHALAVLQYRRAKEAGIVRADSRIGIIASFAPSYTKKMPSDADLEAVRMTDGIANRWWLDLIRNGFLPEDVLETIVKRGVTRDTRLGDEQILAHGVVDWLGCNYYQPARVQAPHLDEDEQGQPVFAENYDWPERVMNRSRGWEIYPRGLYDFGMMLKRDYPGLEWFVSENGMGVEGEASHRDVQGEIADDYRIDFVASHLAWVLRAKAEGSLCRGYHAWAPIDNWSWTHAFKNRYGFVEVDLADGYRRRFKKSARWFKDVTKNRSFAQVS